MKILKNVAFVSLMLMAVSIPNSKAQVNWPGVVNGFIIPCGAAVLFTDALVKTDESSQNGVRVIACGIFMSYMNPSGRTGFGGQSRSEIEKQIDEWERMPALYNLLPPEQKDK